jgi:hypothetical protein
MTVERAERMGRAANQTGAHKMDWTGQTLGAALCVAPKNEIFRVSAWMSDQNSRALRGRLADGGECVVWQEPGKKMILANGKITEKSNSYEAAEFLNKLGFVAITTSE